MNSITLRSPAKINLCLSVLGKRPDGYHEVEMIMQMVGLYDEVSVAVGGAGVQVASDNSAVPGGETNIAWKAADRMLRALGSKEGCAITIRKSIPVAAGLGGGSGNAAAVLVALNELLGAGWSPGRLAELGTELGMDVPFFFYGPTALARGRGELIEPLEPPASGWALLVNPGFETSTAWAYKNVNLRLTKKGLCNKISRLTVRNIAEGLHNDLEAVTAEAHPEIRRMEHALLAQKAAGACMSGSGPTVFGIFDNESDCRAPAANLWGERWRLFPAELLTESPFQKHLGGEKALSVGDGAPPA